MPVGVTTLFTIKVNNAGEASGSTDTSVKITGPDGTHTVTGTSTTVSTGRTGLSYASYRFNAPGAYQIVATVNPRSTVAEESTANNSKADSMTVVVLPEIALATEDAPKTSVPSKPSSTNGYKSVGWSDNGISYNGSIAITATPSQTSLKSGYGFSLDVNVNKTTSYVKPNYVYKPQKVFMYVPEWNYTRAIELQEQSAGVWELPENTRSPGLERKWYVPEWWPDSSDYTVKIECCGAYTPGDVLNVSLLKTIRIDSNMYTDDYTGNRN